MKAQVSIRIKAPRGVLPPAAVLADAAAGARGESVRVKWRAWEAGSVSASRLKRFGVVGDFDRADRLLIDHDYRKAPDIRRYHIALRDLGVVCVAVCYARSPHGWHVVVQLDREYPLLARIAMQFACASDRQRETYNLMRALQLESVCRESEYWRRRANVFYRGSIYAGTPEKGT